MNSPFWSQYFKIVKDNPRVHSLKGKVHVGLYTFNKYVNTHTPMLILYPRIVKVNNLWFKSACANKESSYKSIVCLNFVPPCQIEK